MMCKIVLAVIVSVLLGIQPSTSNPIENENLVNILNLFCLIIFKYLFQLISIWTYIGIIALSEWFDKLQTKVESLESENVKYFNFLHAYTQAYLTLLHSKI